jgi:molybdopterin/thiamine biosynthesis adenylyltransferase
MQPGTFNYNGAFARNLGLLSRTEQEKMRTLTVALPGLGGVGGAHLQSLARMGVGGFRIADPDHFELANLNRQFAATCDTLGESKTTVCAEMIRSINPQARVKSFTDGITEENLDEFLDGVDVVVDGLEFFRFDIRRALYARARTLGIPVVNAGPIGYGAAVLVFMPDGESFDEYFRLNDAMTRAEMVLAMGVGLNPNLSSDIDPSFVDLENEKGPALAPACLLCAAAASMEVLKLVTSRGRSARTGTGMYFDLLRNRTVALQSPSSLMGRLRRALASRVAFRSFPQLKKMHERELSERLAGARA